MTKEYTDSQFVEAARELYEQEGEIEIDDNATISRGDDDGAYVQAWVWVNFHDMTEEVSK